VDEGRTAEKLECLVHHLLDAVPVDLAHREDLDFELADQLPLAWIERTDPEQRGRVSRRVSGTTR